MKDDRERLFDMIEAIDLIEKYAVQGEEAFANDELIRNWMVRHLQILGEAAARISGDFQNRYSEIPWSKIIGMRNILVHDYFAIDIEVVWSVVEKELPKLKSQIQNILDR